VTLTELEELTRLRQGVSAVLSTAGIVGAVLLYLSLALAFAFFLMRDAPRVERWVTTNVADRGSTTYALLSGIDDDLQTVYFGNVLTVLGVTVAAVAVYNGYNLFAPQSLTVPVPTLLGLLTGLATFVPIVVGKLVYVPTVGYLSWLSLQSGESFLYPVVLLVVAVVFLDVLPQTVLRPILSGRGIHSGAVLFSYVLGVAYFGWYGLFLGPLLIVLARQLLGLVVPALLSGGSLGMGGDTDGETPG
jgi:predicted PurR-regulated permease PerM